MSQIIKVFIYLQLNITILHILKEASTVLALETVHAAPQYFLRFTMGVGQNLLQDDFLGLPVHTWEKRIFFNNTVFDLFAFFKALHLLI